MQACPAPVGLAVAVDGLGVRGRGAGLPDRLRAGRAEAIEGGGRKAGVRAWCRGWQRGRRGRHIRSGRTRSNINSIIRRSIVSQSRHDRTPWGPSPIKEGIRFEGKQDMQTKVMITLFGLFAEVERDLISQRTKEGLAAARAKGRLLGRPKGALGKSKLDGKEEKIRLLVEKTVSKASIAKIVGASRTALHHFIRTRKLDPKASKGKTRGRRP